MENMSSHGALSCYIVNITDTKYLVAHRSKLPVAEEKRHFPFLIESGFRVSKYSHLYSLRLKKPGQYKPSTAFCSLERCEHVSSSFLTETYEHEGINGVTSTGKNCLVPKVLIPGLPTEGNGDMVAPISSCFWEWKSKLKVHYKTAGSENVDSPPVLFLPGFGVGSFHYDKQLKDIGRDYRVFALDFLGQGMSLPQEDPTLGLKGGNKLMSDGQEYLWGLGDESEAWAKELVYSVDLWREQVRYFIEEVIKEPVYLVGNSLGGFVALYFTAFNPELVKGVTLLNATPFWGFLPNPERSPELSKLFSWAGTFPLPPLVRKLVETLWLKISDPRNIADILRQVYADHTINVDDVFSHIIETTQHPAAAASLASIIFAPRGQLSFDEALARCKMNCVPICLTYGKEDPWVMPIFGLHVKRQVPDAPYYEISPAGHCPHDEVPEVVNFVLRGWIKNLESGGSCVLPLLDDLKNGDYGVTKELEFSRQGGLTKSVRVTVHGSRFSIFKWLTSLFKPLFVQNKRMDGGFVSHLRL